ncbi:MAG: 50S ribosomal protein L28, partial [Deltaproteobacteria bacterium]|nr:50S ribosomal protein L28 [Deltaproteobacteria bacterium]
MSTMCEICGNKPLVRDNVSHAHNLTKRRFNPNLQKVRSKLANG